MPSQHTGPFAIAVGYDGCEEPESQAVSSDGLIRQGAWIEFWGTTKGEVVGENVLRSS
jgi:hypothetical protein